MPWTINSEIYPLWARNTGNAFATATNWTFNLIISITFFSLTEWITRYGAFWLYGGIAFCGWVFFFVYIPETKGKSLEELEHIFNTERNLLKNPRTIHTKQNSNQDYNQDKGPHINY